MGYSDVIEGRNHLVTISIVSHGQGRLVAELLKDLVAYPTINKIIITQNIPETNIWVPPSLEGKITFVRNEKRLGFGANHNQASYYCTTPYFVVLNPDIRIPQDPFPHLLRAIRQENVGVVAPLVRAPNGKNEDSVRYFPTPLSLVGKILGLSDGSYKVIDQAPQRVDWVAGMFMLFDVKHFKSVGGFDERFFLYYEDVDICARFWLTGRQVIIQPSTFVIHSAQRASHRNIRYLSWHLLSLARYFYKHLGRQKRRDSNIVNL